MIAVEEAAVRIDQVLGQLLRPFGIVPPREGEGSLDGDHRSDLRSGRTPSKSFMSVSKAFFVGVSRAARS